MHQFAPAICAAALLSASYVSAQNASIGATVRTQSGSATGHAASNRTQVSEYLGIPYAQPPIGKLRFDKPRTYNSTQAFNASSFVWTKSPGSAQKKGVILWLHGGRFTVGDTNTPFYTGQYLVDEQDLVFVSVNYRLNIFGFPGSPSAPANLGLLDQRKAIEWVRDNIAAFGGDPSRITIMGQSAGGSAVDYYSYAYTKDPIVAGLISHSGTALSFTPNTPAYSATSFASAAASLNCTGSDDDVLSCMRTKPFDAVLNATAKAKPLPSVALPQPVFHPTVDNITVFGNYSALSSAGAFAKIPYLAGNTDNEDGFYHIAAAGANITLTDSQWQLYDLEGFTCATASETAARARAGVPVWRYRYFGQWPNLELYNTSGSYHGSDLHMIFGAAQDVTGIDNIFAENQLSKFMMRAWASFVNDPKNGLWDVMGWPTYSPSNNGLISLGGAGLTGALYDPSKYYDDGCPANGSVAEAQGAF